MKKCARCGSYAINHHSHGRDGSGPELCDVCYWRSRAEKLAPVAQPTDDQIDRLVSERGTGGWQTRGDMARFARAVLALRGAHQPAPVAQPLSAFDEIDDETIDAACVAGGIYRVDLMRAYNVLRAHKIGGPA